jgi:hypothetical protein
MPFFAHHAIICALFFASISSTVRLTLFLSPDVPIGYIQPELNDNTEIHGGSPYGASTIAHGDGSRQPDPKELKIAEFQGAHFARTVSTYLKGYGIVLVHFSPCPRGVTSRIKLIFLFLVLAQSRGVW